MSGKDKVVLITGCSKGGIGYELSKAFSKAGMKVFSTARRKESMDGLYELGIELEKLDVTDPDSISRAIENIIQKVGRIDILVNNAGAGCTGPLAELPLNDIRSNFETNVFGLLAMVQAVVPYMSAQESGKIINIGSVVGWVATPWGGSYCATKSAVHSLTHTLRMELRPLGIKVVLVCPGSIKSNIGVNNLKKLDDKKWKLYAGYQSQIESRATISQQENSTPAEAFANRVVQVCLRDNPPYVFSFGTNSSLFLFLSFLPHFILDFFVCRKLGLPGW